MKVCVFAGASSKNPPNAPPIKTDFPIDPILDVSGTIIPYPYLCYFINTTT